MSVYHASDFVADVEELVDQFVDAPFGGDGGEGLENLYEILSGLVKGIAWRDKKTEPEKNTHVVMARRMQGEWMYAVGFYQGNGLVAPTGAWAVVEYWAPITGVPE